MTQLKMTQLVNEESGPKSSLPGHRENILHYPTKLDLRKNISLFKAEEGESSRSLSSLSR